MTLNVCVCDVCRAATNFQEATVYTADEFRQVVDLGYKPLESVFKGAFTFSEWARVWVANSRTDWVLCPSCAHAAGAFMPKPVGTGLLSPATVEFVTEEMLHQLMGPESHTVGAIWPTKERGFLDDELFASDLASAVECVDILLGTQYVSARFRKRDPIGRWLRRIAQYSQKGPVFSRDWETLRLRHLVADLGKLSKAEPAAFAVIRRKYRKLTPAEFFGWRHEVSLAARLAEQRIPFRKTEAPDFTILGDYTGIYAECASVNLPGPKDSDVAYKITACIRQKGKKPYCNDQTVLFVDYTNVFYNSVISARPLHAPDIDRATADGIAATRFGAVMAMAVLADMDSNSFFQGGALEVSKTASAKIGPFLQAFAPDAGPREARFVPPFSI